MSPGELITVSLAGPREKFWGSLVCLNAMGVTVRGLPVESFEDWLRQHASGGANLLGPITAFFPAHRVERVELDESVGVVEGLGDRFRRLVGRDPRDELLGPPEPDASTPGN